MNRPTGETRLPQLLAGLAPELVARPRIIRTQPHTAPVPADAVLVHREDEGTTVIVPAVDDDAGDEPHWAQVVLRIHSSLDAVGMMAAVSAALAARGIPCNAVSAWYHDHLFVPWARRDETVAALQALAASHSATSID
jgi:hypothetical protein